MGAPLRVLSFLGRAAAPHYAAVAARVAAELGVACEPLREPGLAALDAELRAGPALVFLCGLPYVRARAAGAPVEAVAAPVPVGAAGPVYAADLVVRAGIAADLRRALAAPRVGYNGDDSLSGWVLPRAGMRALGLDPDAVRWVRTGSHARSLGLLARGELDAAPIDSIVLALERRLDRAVEALAVAGRLGEAPSPPVCTVGGDAALAGAIGEVLRSLPADAEGRAVLALGGLERYAPAADDAYDPVRALDGVGRAARRGEEGG